jgi:hypothetical protein
VSQTISVSSLLVFFFTTWTDHVDSPWTDCVDSPTVHLPTHTHGIRAQLPGSNSRPQNICLERKQSGVVRGEGTTDGSSDILIKVQGADSYSFCDADGGEPLADSDDEDGSDGEDDDVQIDDEGQDPDDPVDDDDDDFSGGEDSSDEEDDTADTVATYIGNATAPEGYKIVEECPALTTDPDQQNFIGKTVLMGWDTKDAQGWFLGTVHSTGPFTKADKKRVPTANFVVKYSLNLTAKKLNGTVAHELTERTHGVKQWWVQVEKV